MRRREVFPKPGDRIRFEVPAPPGAPSKERRGTVLERSCGRSGALRVQWDADGTTPTTESWLADAAWHWSHSTLRVVSGGKKGIQDIRPAAATPAPVSRDAGDLWPSDDRTRPMAHAVGVGAAAEEWEAALAAESAPVHDDSWENVLAGALGLSAAGSAPGPAAPRPVAAAAPAPAPRPAPAPAAPAPVPVGAGAPAARPWSGDDILPGASRGASRAAVPPRPAPTPAPPPPAAAPPRAPAAPAAPRPWTGDDILPGGGSRKGRKRG